MSNLLNRLELLFNNNNQDQQRLTNCGDQFDLIEDTNQNTIEEVTQPPNIFYQVIQTLSRNRIRSSLTQGQSYSSTSNDLLNGSRNTSFYHLSDIRHSSIVSSAASEPVTVLNRNHSMSQPQSQPNSNYSLSFLCSNNSNSVPNEGTTRQNRRHRRRNGSNRSHSRNSSNAPITANTSLTSSNTGSLSLSVFNSKRIERNLLSASCAVFCIAILAVSLVETRWFYLNGGGCNVNYLGVAHFFAPGRLELQIEMSKVTKNEITVYSFILPNGLVLKNCANREIMLIMRTVIAFVFLAIFSSCIGLILDTFGCMKSGMKLVRRHAIFHILTVVFCLFINGFCFWISEKMNDQQNETRNKKGKKIDVSFDVSYYLIVLASGLSILATAFTLIRRYPTDEDEQLERLLEEYTGFDEPIHLERSLPATTPLLTPSLTQQNFFMSNNSNQQCNINLPDIRTNQIAPPPPATPPPPLHLNVLAYDQNRLNEPPPPYDPTPSIA